MRLLEEPELKKSIWNHKGMSVLEKGFFYGGLFDQDTVIESGASSRDEEFLASVLLMIKSEEVNNQQDMPSKIKRFEYISQTCDEHKWKHAMCPPNCPNRRIERILKWSEDGPYHLDGETGSSSLEEENGIRYHTDGGSSSDELFDDIAYRRRLAKIRTKPSTSSSAIKPKKPKRLPSKLDIDATYSNGNAKVRGTKRKTESYDSFHADVVSQPKRKYSKQRKVIKGMEMFWNAPTESYGLAKPKSSEQYELVVRWSLSQLPKKCGTTEDVFSTVKENGWPELKKGNTREALICKNTITKILYEHFMEKSIDEKGEVVFCFGDEEDENVDVEEEGHTDVDPKSSSYSKHRIEERYMEDCFSNRNARKLDSAEELKRLERKPRREVRKKLSEIDSAVWQLSSSSSSNCVEDEASEETHQTPTVPKKQAKKALPSNSSSSSLARGRRWVRFACEKHRREHARCPDNCPMRKKSYVEEEVIDDENTPDDMETESLHLKDTLHVEEEVIVDESSM